MVTAYTLEVRGNLQAHHVESRKVDVYKTLRGLGWENSKQMKEDGMKVVKVRLVKV